MSFPPRPIKWYKKLAAKKGRLDAGAFLVEGDKAIRQIIGCCPQAILEIVAIDEPPSAYGGYPIRLVNESQFRSICLTRMLQGIMAIVSLPKDAYSDDLPQDAGDKILLLEDVQDPGNVGTLIRTAAAFDFSSVIMTEGCADPFSPKCVQASAGAVLSLWLRRTVGYLRLAGSMKAGGHTLIAADLNGTAEPLVLRNRKRLLLALGNEAAGLSPALLYMADHRLWIPTVREKAESLNVAACGAICMYLSSTG